MQEKRYAVFGREAIDLEELKAQTTSPTAEKKRTTFEVEKIVLMPDSAYTAFCASGLIQDQAFLFENRERMWFDPAEGCWHCLLVKGETSRDGVLVEAEGFSYARYAAYISDCSVLSLEGTPVQYEYPLHPHQPQRLKRHDRER